MRVELVRATAETASVEELDVPEGATLGEALEASRFASTPAAAYAVFGRLATTEHVLEDGDRIELLRDLVIDPKEARRRRAAGRDGKNP